MIPLSALYGYVAGYIDKSAYLNSKPSLQFEEKTGVKGISASYKFPGDKSAAEYGHLAFTLLLSNKKNAQRVWDRIVHINPELEIIEPEKNTDLCETALAGVVSLYNPKDIKFFIDITKLGPKTIPVALLTKHNKTYHNLSRSIEDRTGTPLQWVAAPETLVCIYNQVKGRPVIGLDRPYDFGFPDSIYWTGDGYKTVDPKDVTKVSELILLPSEFDETQIEANI